MADKPKSLADHFARLAELVASEKVSQKEAVEGRELINVLFRYNALGTATQLEAKLGRGEPEAVKAPETPAPEKPADKPAAKTAAKK